MALGRAAIVGWVGTRQRTVALVAAIAVAAAGATVGATALQSDRAESPLAGAPATSEPLKGAPPLVLELGVRDDKEARDLRAASALLDQGRRDDAARGFIAYPSLEAQVGQVIAQWSPDSSVRGLQALALEHPESGLVQLHLGLALVWVGRIGEAANAWRLAVQKDPDTPYAVRSADLLHPDLPRGLPVFVPSFPDPAGLQGLTPPKQLAELRARAANGGVRERIAYGVYLQTLNQRISAERQFSLAAEAAPDDPEALAGLAFSRFDKEDPARAAGEFGPLTQRFPQSATVRYHFGALLLWLGRIDDARKQLQLAVDNGRQGQAVVTAAATLLAELAKLK